MVKKKLGPLPLWQWIAIGAAVGLATYLYRRGHPAAAGAQTPASAVYNPNTGPLDPTTGLPYAQGSGLLAGAAGAATAATVPTLAMELGDLGAILDLVAGLNSLVPAPRVDTNADTVAGHTGAAPAKAAKTKTKTPTAKKQTTSKKNPGHAITHHGQTRRTASSSAPHNSRQHQNVAPPAHQRAPATAHHTTPSVGHKVSQTFKPAKKRR